MARKLKPRKDGRVPIHREGKFFYGKTAKEAEAKYNEWKRLKEAGLSKDSTVRSYAGKWLPLHKNGVSDKVYSDYAAHINVLIDAIGDMIMRKVTVDDAKRVYLHYNGYSQSTIKRARMLYIDLFDTAIENGLCLKNPFKSKKAQPDRGSEGSHRQITQEEMDLILETQHSLRPAVMIMLFAGLRRGEALAIDVDRDIDFDNNTINVNYAVRFDGNQAILCDPKTEAGKRQIAMVGRLKDELKDIHGLLAPAKRSCDLMSESAFSSAWHSYINTIECKINGVNQKRWYGRTKEHKKRIEKAEQLKKEGKFKEAKEMVLPKWKTFTVRPHDLRHTYCTMLRDAGVDMKQTMAWMGHADEKMVLKIYDHITPERTAKSVQQVEDLFKKLSI